jgi:hypothetical protein
VLAYVLARSSGSASTSASSAWIASVMSCETDGSHSGSSVNLRMSSRIRSSDPIRESLLRDRHRSSCDRSTTSRAGERAASWCQSAAARRARASRRGSSDCCSGSIPGTCSARFRFCSPGSSRPTETTCAAPGGHGGTHTPRVRVAHAARRCGGPRQEARWTPVPTNRDKPDGRADARARQRSRTPGRHQVCLHHDLTSSPDPRRSR